MPIGIVDAVIDGYTSAYNHGKAPGAYELIDSFLDFFLSNINNCPPWSRYWRIIDNDHHVYGLILNYGRTNNSKLEIKISMA